MLEIIEKQGFPGETCAVLAARFPSCLSGVVEPSLFHRGPPHITPAVNSDETWRALVLTPK